MKPGPSEYSGYLGNYITLAKEDTVTLALNSSAQKLITLLKTINDQKAGFRYAPGKWSIKEILVHVMDTERIFAYRALAFSRGEKEKLPAFDENMYALNSNADNRHYDDLLDEMAALHLSTHVLFKGFSDKQLLQKGIIPAGEVSVNALGYAISGHNLHHLGVLRERYLK